MKMWVICTGLLLLANPAFSAACFAASIPRACHFQSAGLPHGPKQRATTGGQPEAQSDETVRMATTASSTNHGRKVGNDVAVVAEKDDGCGNRVTGSERRSAIISKSIRAGMTRSDVESAPGRPESTTSTNGRDRLRFRDGKGRCARSASMNTAACWASASSPCRKGPASLQALL